ncbi:Metal tolerance protein C4 [Nymphaea thermarum]|nr:Metal tolerance protein C4 [Nymphaea thermarum]
MVRTDSEATTRNPRQQRGKHERRDNPEASTQIPRQQHTRNPRRRRGTLCGGVPSNRTTSRMGCKRKTDAGTSTALSDDNFHDERSTKNFREAAKGKDDTHLFNLMSSYGEEVVTALGSEVDRLEKEIQKIVPGIRHVDIEAHNPKGPLP